MSVRQRYAPLQDGTEFVSPEQISEDSATDNKSFLKLEDSMGLELSNLDNEQLSEIREIRSKRSHCCSVVKELEGKLLIFTGGTISIIVVSMVKHISHMPVGEYMFFLFAISLTIMLPALFFQERSVDAKGKLKYVLIRACCGAVAGTLTFWSAREMDYGDAISIFALSPIFASLFSRVLWKEKLSLFTIVSLVLGFGGLVLIARPAFIFGTDQEKMYSISTYFPIVPVLGAVMLGFAHCCMRKVGTDINMLVVPIYTAFSAMMTAVAFNFAKDDVVILPYCYSDRIVLFFAGFGAVFAMVLLNKGLAIEKSGPGTLIRNLDIVTGYILQVLFFNNHPEMLSVIGAVLILASVVLSTVNKLFCEKFNNKWEI